MLEVHRSNTLAWFLQLKPSIGGECETLYKVKPLTSTSGDPQIHVTKVRNYDNCINRPKYFASIFHGKQCAECIKARVSICVYMNITCVFNRIWFELLTSMIVWINETVVLFYSQSEPLKSVSLVRYTLIGSSRLFQIQSAISESQHVFTPYSDKGGSIATYLK